MRPAIASARRNGSVLPKSNPYVLMVQPTEDRPHFDVPSTLNDRALHNKCRPAAGCDYADHQLNTASATHLQDMMLHMLGKRFN